MMMLAIVLFIIVCTILCVLAIGYQASKVWNDEDAQAEYEENLELQELLKSAAESETKHRSIENHHHE